MQISPDTNREGLTRLTHELKIGGMGNFLHYRIVRSEREIAAENGLRNGIPTDVYVYGLPNGCGNRCALIALSQIAIQGPESGPNQHGYRKFWDSVQAGG